jgi:hypothetical protein
MKTAARMFVVLPLSSLTAADLKSNADTGLNMKVKHTMLGACDALISHSWSVSNPIARLHTRAD